jgi:pseudaminic acid biosynthesis-associated methylase
MNKQEKFWHSEYASEYIERNQKFDIDLGITAWEKMLTEVDLNTLSSVLELGCNIGRNLHIFEQLLPEAQKSIVEISPLAFNTVTKNFKLKDSQNKSILESDLPLNSFDLVFTSGVLIHVNPNDLIKTMSKMYNYSKKYILICEMFSRTPKTVHYRNEDDLLFTRDFGRLFLENYSCKVVDYGFLWGHYFDAAGFDDANFWLFEK